VLVEGALDMGTTQANDDTEVLMWLYFILAVALLFAVILTVVSGGAWTIFAIFTLGLAVAGVVLLRIIQSGRDAPQVVGRPPDPTGVPRRRAGAGTANVRVGQEPSDGGSA
jgi:hypothetical protein